MNNSATSKAELGNSELALTAGARTVPDAVKPDMHVQIQEGRRMRMERKKDSDPETNYLCEASAVHTYSKRQHLLRYGHDPDTIEVLCSFVSRHL